MPTTLEIPEPTVRKEVSAGRPAAQPLQGPVLEPGQLPWSRPMFHDSLLESETPDRRRRSLATTVSFAFQCVLVGIALLLPLMFTQALPNQQLLTYLIAPPPPPPPPPPAAPVKVVKMVQTDILSSGALRTPTRIPQKIEMIREEAAPPPAAPGVVGGIPGGVPGGQLGGVIGGIISSTSTSTSLPAPILPKRIRISQGVIQGQLIRRVEPDYPVIAKAAHITGTVVLRAIISRSGDIEQLQAVQGHPLLVPAAINAVKQWRYRPYLLNGEPVEIETTIIVNFILSS